MNALEYEKNIRTGLVKSNKNLAYRMPLHSSILYEI